MYRLYYNPDFISLTGVITSPPAEKVIKMLPRKITVKKKLLKIWSLHNSLVHLAATTKLNLDIEAL